MGAEQIGYLVKGPEEITINDTLPSWRSKKSEAMRRLAVCREIAKWDNTSPVKSVWIDQSREAGYHDDLQTYAMELQSLQLPLTLKGFVKFARWWNNPDARDVNYRTDPDDVGKIILFAGTQTWGDEPDGLGYQYLKWAFYTGCARALGIR